uniref:Centromere/kinetochore protein zw10 N-terminal domain-containing protein n=1 Tax=Gopherus evgoodei TaxID=1825980 RepID=A0A8C4WED6_9SAUR
MAGKEQNVLNRFKEDLGTRIARLSRRVGELGGEVCNMINKTYNEFLPSMQSTEDLVSQVDSLSGNMDLLKSRIENEVTWQRFHIVCIYCPLPCHSGFEI